MFLGLISHNESQWSGLIFFVEGLFFENAKLLSGEKFWQIQTFLD